MEKIPGDSKFSCGLNILKICADITDYLQLSRLYKTEKYKTKLARN